MGYIITVSSFFFFTALVGFGTWLMTRKKEIRFEKVFFLVGRSLTFFVFCVLGASVTYAATWDLKFASLKIEEDARASLTFPDGKMVSVANAFQIQLATGAVQYAERVELDAEGNEKENESFRVFFPNGVCAFFRIEAHDGFALVNIEKVDIPESVGEVEEMTIFRFDMPKEGKYVSTINNVIWDEKKFGLMTASINVRPMLETPRGTNNDQKGCSHTFAQEGNSAEMVAECGKSFARFNATSDREDRGGWSVRGKNFEKPLDLTGCVAIRARVLGDGKGQSLKIQLGSGAKGHRDDYIPVDFTGWKTVTLTSPALNDLDYGNVTRILFYYNGMPAKTSVSCGIDQVEAVFKNTDGTERTVILEDFESDALCYWDSTLPRLNVRTYTRHELAPGAFGIVAAPVTEWKFVVQKFQEVAGLPCPRPGGGWRNDSPWTKQSYFFLTNFREEQFDDALAIAKRGGFKQILLLQYSWINPPGHYDNVPKSCFPDGIEGLRRVIDKFHAEGIRFGFHYLAASIDPPDAYLTPVPDKRLVADLSATLAKDISATDTVLPTMLSPDTFPFQEDPYTGRGQCLWIDDELIWYNAISTTENGENPLGFGKCIRGYMGTKPTEHKAGAEIRLLVRAYGYYMYDLDTDLCEEVAENCAKLVNQLPIDMMYFDGSERLQRPSEWRDHWYYNAKLHRAFYDAFENKNILYQASSFSPYSWYQLARSASADGHDDLKAYLDERSGSFQYFAESEMPLDIGWYYGYDRRATPDMYEYILGATIGYNSSMSFQVSVDAAHAHPFMGEILDMIREYENLRLSGRVPQEMRERLHIDPKLRGTKSDEERNRLSLAHRREYRLVKIDGKEYFQRVIYPLWEEVKSGDTWTLEVRDVPATIGFQIQYMDAKEWKKRDDLATAQRDGKIVKPRIFVDGKELVLDMTLTLGQYGFTLPNRPDAKYGTPLKEPEYATTCATGVRLAPGKYTVKFECETEDNVPIRVRTPMFLDEKHEIPAE